MRKMRPTDKQVYQIKKWLGDEFLMDEKKHSVTFADVITTKARWGECPFIDLSYHESSVLRAIYSLNCKFCLSWFPKIGDRKSPSRTCPCYCSAYGVKYVREQAIKMIKGR